MPDGQSYVGGLGVGNGGPPSGISGVFSGSPSAHPPGGQSFGGVGTGVLGVGRESLHPHGGHPGFFTGRFHVTGGNTVGQWFTVVSGVAVDSGSHVHGHGVVGGQFGGHVGGVCVGGGLVCGGHVGGVGGVPVGGGFVGGGQVGGGLVGGGLVGGVGGVGGVPAGGVGGVGGVSVGGGLDGGFVGGLGGVGTVGESQSSSKY